MDLFCKKAGVARRRSEANNQESNGKAERMHRTIINTAKSIVFACGLPLSFGGRRAIRSLYPKQITNQRKSGEGVAVEDTDEQTPSLGEIGSAQQGMIEGVDAAEAADGGGTGAANNQKKSRKTCQEGVATRAACNALDHASDCERRGRVRTAG
ncbi:Transposon Polyprotein integrase [Phytophthora palmivora]|uniref:Transposon Polyprotein integrase n=1 Tax=Phytophthora palmivora TaxID=4796 RepID=A0A2P4XGR2_9STRA|nr:Transposon Polyprotein integrase [Phytophthora palmivora]